MSGMRLRSGLTSAGRASSFDLPSGALDLTGGDGRWLASVAGVAGAGVESRW